MKKFLTIIILFSFSSLFGQKKNSDKSSEWNSFKTFGFELLGDEGLYSITYEGKIYNKNYNALTCRGGIEFIPHRVLPMLGVNYLYGKQKIHLQCGAHIIYNFGPGNNDNNNLFMSFSIGPRFKMGKEMIVGVKYNYLYFPLNVSTSKNWGGITWTFPL